MAFTHLHVHTEYSLLDGSNKIKEYVARVKELGMNSAAITDHGVMYGVIDFYRAAREAGIKPILGCEVYVAPNSRFDKELTGGEDRYHHLVLLAENNTGYANLMKIVSRGFTEGYYYKPRVDMEVLQEFHEGIIALSACLAGEVPRFILKGMKDEARKAARKYEACFGKGNYFLELQDHGIPEQRTVNMELLQMSRELDIPLVTTNDVHYTYAEDAIPHDILLCLQTGKKLADEDRMRYEGGQYYAKLYLHITTVCNPLGILHGLPCIGEQSLHFLFALDIILSALVAHTILVRQLFARLQAQQNVMRDRILRIGIVHIVGGHQGNVQLPAHLDQFHIHGSLFRDAVIL